MKKVSSRNLPQTHKRSEKSQMDLIIQQGIADENRATLSICMRGGSAGGTRIDFMLQVMEVSPN